MDGGENPIEDLHLFAYQCPHIYPFLCFMKRYNRIIFTLAMDR